MKNPIHYGKKIQVAFSILTFLLSFQVLFGQSVQFDLTTLNFNGFASPSQGTALKFGPDNKLYLAQLNGLIRVYTIGNSGSNSYTVTALQTITQVRSIPNHDDIGTAAWDGRSNRQITGIEVVGTAENPIIYVGSSDPKWGGPSGDKVLDTNSGIITKLTWTGTAWDVVDLVRGLPRSEENHSTNAVKHTLINNQPFLLVASGGFTNGGSPSTNFTWITEYALSAAILSVDLDAIEALPTKTDPISGRKFKYDIPTLDDPSRPNVNGIYDPNHPSYDGIDVGDPFGGNDGLNMAMLVTDGPVQIFSPGYRNAYDFVVTEAGKVFVTDNGPNASWGGLPENEGNANTVTNNYLVGEPGTSSTRKSQSGEYVTNRDRLLMITNNINNYQPGAFYGGHPAPIRANPGIPYASGSTFPFNPGGAGLYTKSIGDEYNGTTLKPLYTQNEIFRTQILQPIAPGSPGFDHYAQTSLPANWPPVPLNLRNLNEADYRDPFLGNLNGPQLEIVTLWKINSNGLDEYKASNFGGALKGSIIAGRNQGFLHLVRLNPDGSLLSLEEDKWNLNGGNSLGINCQGDNDIFPGTIWVATYNNTVHILTPSNNPFCPSPDDPFFDPNADYDNDGYTNQDEIDNGTDYCSGASRPSDFDGDFVSDLNDLDDDGDGIPDQLDPFQLGSPTDLPIDNELFSDKTDDLGRPFGYRGLGLTGLMNNGAPNPNWMNWLDKLDEGPLPNDIYGGAAGAIQIAITGGTANGIANNQDKGFQLGVNVGIETGEFLIIGGLLGFQGPQMFYDIDHSGELGIQMGDGTQSNFLKLVFTKTGIMAGMEINDIPDPNPLVLPLAVGDRPLSSEIVEFLFLVNPSNGTVVPQVKIGQRPIINLGTKILTGKILEAVQNYSTPLAIGVFGTSANQGIEFLSTYDYFKVFGERPFITNPLIDISRQTGAPSKEIDLSDYFDDHGGFENLNFSIVNTNPNIGATISASILTLTFPNFTANATITVRAADQNGFFVEQSFDVSVFAAEQTVFRINAGGQLIEGQNSYQDWKSNDSNGSFNGDGYSVDSGIVKNGNLSFENKHSSIPNYIDPATFDEIFSKEREKNGQGSMIFSIPLDPAEYIVRLYFGNSGSNTSNTGDRFFDIKIEGQLVFNDFDLVQRFGHGSAGMEEFSANVNDGVLNIEFIKQTGNPTISAIEVLKAVSPPPPLIFLNPVQDQISTVNEVLEGNLLFTASGGVGALHYSAINLPPGVDIEAVNGRLYGTIASNAIANSPYTVTLTVTDSNSPVANSEFVTFNWTILPFEKWNIMNENQNYTPRHENSFVQAGEAFYLMGGRGSENPRTIDIYNYQQDTWNSLVNIAPVEFNHFQATEYKGYIWVIGAFQTNNFPSEEPATHIWIFDPVNELYIQGPEIPVERRRGSSGLVIHNDKFYVIAGNKLGHSGQYVDYFDEFDPATGTWTVLPSAPRPRDHFHATVIGNKIYVASGRLSGGFGGTFGPVIKEVDVYDFETQSWSTLPSALDIPTPRAAAVVANFGGKLLVAGGEIPDNTEALAITEIFDPATQTWATGSNLNFRRHGTQGIVSGNGLFVAAGSPNRGGGRQRNMEFYGLNNPTGIPITESILSGPENILLGSGNEASFVLSTSTGNQGVVIQNISLSGIDANDFNISNGYLSKGFINPNSSHTITLVYQGSKPSPVANLRVQYKTNAVLEIPISRQAISSNLAGHWKMDEGSGNILIDHSGFGNDAIIQNTGGVTWSPGVIDLGINLTGSTGRFGIAPHNASLEIGESITIAGWVKPNVLGRNTVISKSDGNGFELTLSNDGFIYFFLNRANNGNSYRLISNFNYEGRLNQWLHIAATYDGNTSRIFVNGVEDASAAFGPVNIGTTSGGISIGAYGSIQRFKGSLDDLRLYGRALSNAEVQALFSGEVIVPTLPSRPILLNPENGLSEVPTSPFLSWSESVNTSSYTLQVATDLSFSSLVINLSEIIETATTVSGLQNGTQYFWRVRASNGTDVSVWSEARSFTTIASGSESEGPVAYWKMDEGSGDILIDHSGNGNDAVIQNTGGVTWSPGVIGLALDLTGSRDRFGIAPHNASLEIGESITITGWVKPNVFGRNTIISKSDGNGFELTLNNDGFIHFFLNRGNSGGSYRLTSNFNYENRLDEWLHIAATYDGNTSKIFVNGTEDASASFGPLNINTASGGLSIGAYGTIQRFKGSLDDLRLYGRALSNSEVQALFSGEIIVPTLPSRPILLSPENGQSEVSTSPLLNWSESANTSSYTLQVATDLSFGSPISNFSGVTETAVKVSGLQNATQYFWRVRAFKGSDVSAWSEVWTFTTLPEGPGVEKLAGHWKMDEGSGNLMVDHSGNGNNATIQNTSGITWSPGVIGLAITLNGNSGRFGIAPHSASLQIGESITIAGWVKPKVFGRNTIISKSDGNGFELTLNLDGFIHFFLNRGNSGGTFRLTSNFNYEGRLDEWLHIAATYDGNTSRIFVNGVEDASSYYGPLSIGTASGELSIGAFGTIQRFKGSLDDLRLYGRALNGSEISALANPNQALRINGTIKEKGIGIESGIENMLSEDLPAGMQTVVGLFPNPVDHEINLKFSGYDETILHISIFDARGVRMKEGEFEVNNGLLTMDISPWKLKPGVHIIVINNNGQQQILKFIKK